MLVDSVQSQANRLEEALLAAVREKTISLPYVTVDFRQAQLAGLTEITSLDAPHRVYDAILRDSLLDGQPFMKSPLGLRLAEAKAERRDRAAGDLAHGAAVRCLAFDRRRRRARRQVPALPRVGDRGRGCAGRGWPGRRPHRRGRGAHLGPPDGQPHRPAGRAAPGRSVQGARTAAGTW